MRNIIKSYFSDESGAAAAEYALILTIIGTAIAAGITVLGSDISVALAAAGSKIATFNY